MTASMAGSKLELVLDEELKSIIAQGVDHVFTTTFGVPVEALSYSIVNEFEGKGDISGMMGLVQDSMEGTLSVSFPKETLFPILGGMYGIEFTEINKSVRDAVGELTNITYALVKKALNERGYRFKMSIPNVVVGDAHSVFHFHQGQTMNIPFKTKFGMFTVSVTVQGSNLSGASRK